MARWLRLKDIELTDDRPPIADVMLNVTVSPYDVPDAVRGFRTDDDKLRIEFRYIDGNEPTKPRKYNQHLVVYEGEHTGRLIAMVVDMDSAGATTCGLAIETEQAPESMFDLSEDLEDAWDQITTDSSAEADRLRTKRFAKRAFETRKLDLLKQLTGAD